MGEVVCRYCQGGNLQVLGDGQVMLAEERIPLVAHARAPRPGQGLLVCPGCAGVYRLLCMLSQEQVAALIAAGQAKTRP